MTLVADPVLEGEDLWEGPGPGGLPLHPQPLPREGAQAHAFWREKDLERPSSTRLEARVPSHGSGAVTRSPSPLAWRPDFPGAPREAH